MTLYNALSIFLSFVAIAISGLALVTLYQTGKRARSIFEDIRRVLPPPPDETDALPVACPRCFTRSPIDITAADDRRRKYLCSASDCALVFETDAPGFGHG